jgi:hypothetical protein
VKRLADEGAWVRRGGDDACQRPWFDECASPHPAPGLAGLLLGSDVVHSRSTSRSWRRYFQDEAPGGLAEEVLQRGIPSGYGSGYDESFHFANLRMARSCGSLEMQALNKLLRG